MSTIFLIVVTQLICVWCQNTRVCQLQDGTAGKCVPLWECKIAMTNYLESSTMPTMCPFVNSVRRVCCPEMKRVEKCEFYAEYSFENIRTSWFGNRSPQVIRTNKCGRNSAPLIIGGEIVRPREYPHSALLGYRPDDEILWRCGGSLVSSRYVLTAGHCLQNTVLGFVIKVRLGELNYNSTVDDARPVDYDIETRIRHPDYKRLRHYNDIALLKLSSQAILSPYVRPVCLPTADSEPNEYIATGWGLTEPYGNPSDTLMKVKLQSYGFDGCQKSYNQYINRKLRDGLQPSQLCAGSRAGHRNTCLGDSGGPLQLYHPDVTCSYIQYGITSFGVSCERSDFPSVYTRIFYYVDWIESIIWATGEDV